MTDNLQVITRRGAEVAADIDEVGRFRVKWFRDYPYLYDGTLAYEQTYLATFAAEPRSLVIVVKAAADEEATAGRTPGRTLAVSTSVPLMSQADILGSAPQIFRDAGHNPHDFYYYSETLVDPAWRGQGIGRRIYALREAEARRLGFTRVCFASVVRDADDPRLPRPPADYRSNDRFWNRQGFHRTPLTIRFSWPTIQADGSTLEQSNPLEFWIRDLD